MNIFNHLFDIDYWSLQTSFQNFSEFFSISHGNPLGISPLMQIILIFALSLILCGLLFLIRKKNRENLYGCLYAIYFVTLALIYYYGFLKTDLFPAQAGRDGIEHHIAWFCSPSLVGWGWGLVGMASMVFVIYVMLTTMHQIMRHMVSANITRTGITYKDWTWGLSLWIAGALFIVGAYFFHWNTLAAWLMVIYWFVNLAYIIVMCFRGLRVGLGIWQSIGGGILFLVSMIGIMVLVMESIRVSYALVVPIYIVFISTQSRHVKKHELSASL